MTANEHLFENILFRYTRTGDYSIESAKKDPNWDLCDCPIAIYECAIYVIDDMFDWSRSRMELFFPDYNKKPECFILCKDTGFPESII